MNVNLDPIAGYPLARVLTPFYFYLKSNPNEIVVVPENFLTDFFSLPAMARLFHHPVGPGVSAAVVHDYLYVGGWIRDYNTLEWIRRPSHEESDLIFKTGLEVLGVSKIKIEITHLAVGVAKRGYWHKPHRDYYAGEPQGILPTAIPIS